MKGYDESQDMKDALIAAGVPVDRIFCDYAGFRTLDSVVRVPEIFDQTKCRELVARANLLLDIFVLRRSPRFLGQKVTIPA